MKLLVFLILKNYFLGNLTIKNVDDFQDCADYFGKRFIKFVIFLNLGYILMNYSTIAEVREELIKNYLETILSLLSNATPLKRRYCAANILYNLSFEDRKYYINFK